MHFLEMKTNNFFTKKKKPRKKKRKKSAKAKEKKRKKRLVLKIKQKLFLKIKKNKTEKVESINCIEEKDIVIEIENKQGNIHNNFEEIFSDYLFKKLTKQEYDYPKEDLDNTIKIIFSDLENNKLKNELKEVLGISLENEEYKELLEMTPCEYLFR